VDEEQCFRQKERCTHIRVQDAKMPEERKGVCECVGGVVQNVLKYSTVWFVSLPSTSHAPSCVNQEDAGEEKSNSSTNDNYQGSLRA
jgi:hypothetical protein